MRWRKGSREANDEFACEHGDPHDGVAIREEPKGVGCPTLEKACEGSRSMRRRIMLRTEKRSGRFRAMLRSVFVVTACLLCLFVAGCGEGRYDALGGGAVDNDDESDPVGADPGENVCGGEGQLRLDGLAMQPGDACGECDDGVAVCDGDESLVCVGTSQPNECGGCEPLHAEVGDTCGPCGEGSWECDDEGGLECVDQAETNACGGCGELDEQPGVSCGDDGDGVFGCTGPEAVRCVMAGENACGGQELLDEIPGSSCGECNGGVVACDSDEQTTCVDADRGVNDCGGCELLPGILGNRCGACDGEFVCDGEESLSCEGAVGNVCGGCDPLENEPGTPCDDNGSDWVCLSADAVHCPESEPANPCGGNTSLEGHPGDACGPCGDGTWVCSAPDQLSCNNATQPNQCGGCTTLAVEPMTSCGGCGDGIYVCASANDVICVDDSENACGGCGTLPAQPDVSCGCGEYRCTGLNDVACSDPRPENACGGCGELDAQPGEPCGDEGCWQCDDGGVECVANARNDCGGCTDLEAQPGDLCPGEIYPWSCTDTGEVACQKDDWPIEEIDGDEIDTEIEQFTDVWGTDGGGVWVVGSEDRVLHYDAGEWEQFEVDSDVGWEAVWATGDEVWAVGYDLLFDGVLFHYDGTQWEEMRAAEEDPGLYDVDGSPDGDVWAVGERTIIHVGDETSDTVDPPPDGGETNYLVIAAPGDDNIWISDTAGELWHYDGAIWGSEFDSPFVEDLWYSEDDDLLWGVGPQTIAFREGKEMGDEEWQDMGENIDEVSEGHWRGVWSGNAGEVWVVGESDDTNHGAVLKLVEDQQGEWNVELHEQVINRQMTAIWGTSGDDWWAAGQFHRESGDNGGGVLRYAPDE